MVILSLKLLLKINVKEKNKALLYKCFSSSFSTKKVESKLEFLNKQKHKKKTKKNLNMFSIAYSLFCQTVYITSQLIRLPWKVQ